MREVRGDKYWFDTLNTAAWFPFNPQSMTFSLTATVCYCDLEGKSPVTLSLVGATKSYIRQFRFIPNLKYLSNLKKCQKTLRCAYFLQTPITYSQ